MNERIRDLQIQAFAECKTFEGDKVRTDDVFERFAELLVEECRNVVSEVYRNTPLELCGPLLTADEEIAKHFYGVEE